MSRVRVPLPYKDQLDVWGDYTRRQMHEAVVGAKVRTVPIAALLSTQETIGSEMLARYMRGEGNACVGITTDHFAQWQIRQVGNRVNGYFINESIPDTTR